MPLPPPTLGESLRRKVQAWAAPPLEVETGNEQDLVGDPEMQMHFYNLSELTYILHTAGVRQVHSELTDHGGAVGAVMFFRVPG